MIDADTIRVRVDLGFRIFMELDLRLSGIDAPELRGQESEQGKKARDWLSAKIPAGSRVRIATRKGDKYGRWLAQVWPEETAEKSDSFSSRSLNEELLAEGLARPYPSQGT
ncbi:MAG: thermonuclease family protein [Candidatus Micrarchaeota archaeon]